MSGDSVPDYTKNSLSVVKRTLEACAALFTKGHTLDHFDWEESYLTADDIRELNELPGQIKAALAELEA